MLYAHSSHEIDLNVKVFANNISPYNNPTETYKFKKKN